MGRPIKKSYFGNLNAPYTDYPVGGPTGEGGEGVASISVTTTGSYVAEAPTVSIAAPFEPLGTTATAVAHLGAISATYGATRGGNLSTNDYSVGDVLTILGGGTMSTSATFTVSLIETIYKALDSGGTNYEVGNLVTWTGTGYTQGLTISVNAINTLTGAITGFDLVTNGYRDQAALPDPLTSATTAIGTGTSSTGTGATINVGWAIREVTVTDAGDYTDVTTATFTTVNTGSGTGAVLDVTFGVTGVEVTTTGSGYVSAPAVTFSTGTAAATAILTSARSNALAVTAYIPTGSSAVGSDIMKQEASRRYLVRNGQGTGQCKLVAKASGSLLPGEMNLIATDSDGDTYYVTKLTAHRALLTAITGTQFATGRSVGWNITTPVENVSVTIANG